MGFPSTPYHVHPQKYARGTPTAWKSCFHFHLTDKNFHRSIPATSVGNDTPRNKIKDVRRTFHSSYVPFPRPPGGYSFLIFKLWRQIFRALEENRAFLLFAREYISIFRNAMPFDCKHSCHATLHNATLNILRSRNLAHDVC